MKKFLYVAIMALTMGLLASCSGSSSKYTQGGPEPSIDTEKSTVNGVSYDNKTEKCWKVTTHVSASVMGVTATSDEVTYDWCTEFELVATYEYAMWTTAQAGRYANASYSYVATGDKDYESCSSHNNQD